MKRKGLVKLAINGKQARDCGAIHTGIIAYSLNHMVKRETWHKSHQYTPEMLLQARKVLELVRAGRPVDEAVRRNPGPTGGYLAKHVLVAAYKQLVEMGE